jgi:hypothetical protein
MPKILMTAVMVENVPMNRFPKMLTMKATPKTGLGCDGLPPPTRQDRIRAHKKFELTAQ